MTSYHDVVRAAYSPERDEEAWVAGLGRRVRELFDGDVASYVIRTGAIGRARLGAVCMIGNAFRQQWAGMEAMHLTVPTHELQSLYRGGPFVSLWAERVRALRPNASAGEVDFLARGDESLRTVGTHETIGVFGGSARGGCFICVATNMRKLAPRTRWALLRVATHVDAAFRLREAPEAEPDARLDEQGSILEQRAPLDGFVEGIHRGARAMRNAESMSARDPEGALAVWRGLIAGRWSLVRSSEGRGRRALLLRRNEVSESTGDDPASRRLASITALVGRGHSNKFIAYELGLPISTVASDIRRVLTRLGLSQRSELVRLGGGASV